MDLEGLLGRWNKCVNLEVLVGKYTLAKEVALHLCFVDLTSAFDMVNHVKLWQTLVVLGAPNDIVIYLSQIYTFLTSRVQFVLKGECTRDFRVTRGIRQGCVLAPLLFSLYINNVDSYLQKLEIDAPKVGVRPTPVLLYADDAVLITRTANGLQCLIEKFTQFMTEKDLLLNLTKTFVMTCGKNRARTRQHHVGVVKINRVSSFTYLGLFFNRNGTWGTHIKVSNLKILRTIEGIFRFVSKIGNKPTREILALYRSKSITTACYGAAIWGRSNTTSLQIQENKFLKRLLSVPSSTPNYIVHRELFVPYISDLISMAGLILWHGIWTKEETKFTKDIILDCLALDNCRKIPWLEYIYTLLKGCKVTLDRKEPSHIQDYSKKKLKLRFISSMELVREVEIGQKKKCYLLL